MTTATTDKPASLAEKKVDGFNLDRRWVFVHELKSMLSEFHDDDWIELNQVGNINIGRGDNSNIATIDLLWVRIEWWTR